MAYRKPGAKRSPAQRAADYAFERECDSAGMSHEEIAAELSRIRSYTLTRQSVDTDFKKVFALYRNAAVADLTAHRQREIEIAEWLYRDLMRQWKRSCQDAIARCWPRSLSSQDRQTDPPWASCHSKRYLSQSKRHKECRPRLE